jgi:phosphate transport system substrate-binding protein
MRNYNPVLAFIVCLLLFPGFANSHESLTGSGCSVSVPGYLADLAREYEKETGVKIMVLGGGSVRGLVDLQEGRTDFAASCQSKTPEDPVDFEYVTVAWDALVFIVNKQNPVDTVTPQQLKDIYEGRITNWKQLNGPNLDIISIISQKGMGGIGEAIAKYILKGNRPLQRQNSILAASISISEQLVEQMKEGFATSGFGSARKRDVKMLKVNGLLPTRENIISGKYPYKRPLFIVIKKDPKPEARKFVDFVLSREGQRLISSYGMPSLLDMK